MGIIDYIKDSTKRQNDESEAVQRVLASYTKIDEKILKPLLPFAVVLLLISLIIFFLTTWVYLVIGLVCSWFILELIQAFRKRICPTCGKPMKRDYSQGMKPENYYCEEDKIVISTGIKNTSTT
jgi:hypothetical protein